MNNFIYNLLKDHAQGKVTWDNLGEPQKMLRVRFHLPTPRGLGDGHLGCPYGRSMPHHPSDPSLPSPKRPSAVLKLPTPSPRCIPPFVWWSWVKAVWWHLPPLSTCWFWCLCFFFQVINAGVRIYSNEVGNNKKLQLDCPWRITSEGINYMMPYITQRRITVRPFPHILLLLGIFSACSSPAPSTQHPPFSSGSALLVPNRLGFVDPPHRPPFTANEFSVPSGLHRGYEQKTSGHCDFWVSN